MRAPIHTALVLASSAALAVGCAQPTELVLVVDAEPRLTVGRVAVDVFGSGRGQRAETVVGTEGAPRLPLTLGVVPQREGVEDVTFHVAATVRVGDEGVDQTLLRVVRTRFLGGSSRMIHVTLTASCLAHPCPDGQSCDLAGCVPDDVAPESLPSWPGSAPASDPRRCTMQDEICNGFDDDCDDTIDEGIDFASSSEDCGRCGQRCASGNCVDGLCAEERVAHVAAGGAHACAVLSNGDLRCWGGNTRGQLGTSTLLPSRAPQLVTGLGRARAVAAGANHTCIARRDGTVRCWGSNSVGQLGDGTTTQRVLPTVAMGITNAQEVAAGDSHTCVLRANGTVSCFGLNTSGQLGDGTTANRNTPVNVVGVTDAVAIAVNTTHACALRSTGGVQCWGNNSNGQLGDGTTTNRTAPIPVMGLSDAVQIAVGDRFSCALRQSGAVVCWGFNNIGQLGDGTTAQRVIPGAVPGITDATRLVAGSLHLCVRRATGAVQCWGGGTSGQIGDGTYVNRARVSPGVFAVPASEGCTGTGCGEIQMSVEEQHK